MSKPSLSACRLRELFDYDPETGIFSRRVTVAANAVAGAQVGHQQPSRYVPLRVDGRRYQAHRLAWLYVYGEWPAQEIDHINGKPGDNRISNLRDVSRRVNRENQHVARSDNVLSGVMGVTWSAYHKKWKALIRVDGRLKHLKYCASVDEARSIYLDAKRRSHAGCTI